jgi:hypothetical protein
VLYRWQVLRLVSSTKHIFLYGEDIDASVFELVLTPAKRAMLC